MQQKACRVQYKSQYGTEVLMPLCPTSQEFASLTGCKTLTRPTVEAMKRLGYSFEVVQEQRSV
jgi:hypothetical protein